MRHAPNLQLKYRRKGVPRTHKKDRHHRRRHHPPVRPRAPALQREPLAPPPPSATLPARTLAGAARATSLLNLTHGGHRGRAGDRVLPAALPAPQQPRRRRLLVVPRRCPALPLAGEPPSRSRGEEWVTGSKIGAPRGGDPDWCWGLCCVFLFLFPGLRRGACSGARSCAWWMGWSGRAGSSRGARCGRRRRPRRRPGSRRCRGTRGTPGWRSSLARPIDRSHRWVRLLCSSLVARFRTHWKKMSFFC
jgi:hypothetical protein